MAYTRGRLVGRPMFYRKLPGRTERYTPQTIHQLISKIAAKHKLDPLNRHPAQMRRRTKTRGQGEQNEDKEGEAKGDA